MIPSVLSQNKSHLNFHKKINRNSFLTVFLMMIIYINEAMAKSEIKLTKPQSGTDASYFYYIKLIELALSKIGKNDEYVFKFASTVMSQGRVFTELSKIDGLINIFQSGTTVDRERKLLVIRIPLLKGSLGHRISIIHKDNLKKFNKIRSLYDLQKFTACQGSHWPDSDILEDADLPVIRNFSYKGMFAQTEKKYCDYFPRAIVEANSEISAYKKKNHQLQVFDGIIISYPFPMYFFVSPHHKQLAIDIEQGLKLAITDGSFDQYFKKNPITNYLFPLTKWKDSIRIQIPNNYLPKNTPLNDPRLWLSF